MSEALPFLVVIAGLLTGTYFGARALLGQRTSRAWEIGVKRVGDHKIQVCLLRGAEAITVGLPLDTDDPDFNDRIELARCEAHLRAVALNSGVVRP